MYFWAGQDQPSDEPEESFTVLGKNVALKGTLCFTGTVRIDGRLEGEILTRGALEVGTGGVLKGTFNVGTLVNGGKIRGNVTATDKVSLLPSSVLVGEVDTPLLSIEEGARFKGQCNNGLAQALSSATREPQALPSASRLIATRLIGTSLSQGLPDNNRINAEWKSK